MLRLSWASRAAAVLCALCTSVGATASMVSLGSLLPFTGGDAGEGLDLTGNMVYAVNLGGTSQSVQGVTFAAATSTATPPAGVTVNGTGVGSFNYFDTNDPAPVLGNNAANYGATADDNALESMMTSVWFGRVWTLDLAVTTGQQYQLQLLFQEGLWGFQGGAGNGVPGSANRVFNVSVETASPNTLSLAIGSLNTGFETDGASPTQPNPDFGLVFTYVFTAPDNSFRVSLNDLPGGDANTVLNALTLEQVPEPTSLAIVGLGGLLVAFVQRRRN